MSPNYYQYLSGRWFILVTVFYRKKYFLHLTSANKAHLNIRKELQFTVIKPQNDRLCIIITVILRPPLPPCDQQLNNKMSKKNWSRDSIV